MQVRRLLLLATSTLLAVIAVTALLSPVAPVEQDEGTPSPPAASTAREGSGNGDADPPAEAAADLEVLSAAETGQRVRVPAGRALRVRVESDEPVGIQLGENGPVEYADAGAPAEFAVFGQADYDEPVRLLESQRVIGRVTTVEPR